MPEEAKSRLTKPRPLNPRITPDSGNRAQTVNQGKALLARNKHPPAENASAGAKPGEDCALGARATSAADHGVTVQPVTTRAAATPGAMEDWRDANLLWESRSCLC